MYAEKFRFNKTGLLWQSFMPRRKEVRNTLSADLISMQVYPLGFDFNPHREFEKWATVEVSDFADVPDRMETFLLPEGLYAVFQYTGSSTDVSIFQYIFGQRFRRRLQIVANQQWFARFGKIVEFIGFVSFARLRAFKVSDKHR